MVEFALTLPLLALLLFGIIQWGLLFAAHITVRNASSVAARYYAINNTQPAAAEIVAKDTLQPMLKRDIGNASATTTNLPSGLAYQVTVTYDYPLIIPFVVPGGGPTRRLTATTIAR